LKHPTFFTPIKVGWAKPFKENEPLLFLSDLYQFTKWCVHEYGEYVYNLISAYLFYLYNYYFKRKYVCQNHRNALLQQEIIKLIPELTELFLAPTKK